MGKYSVYAIGDRTKTVNDSSVKAIYFRDTPNAIFFDPEKYSFDDLDRQSGYVYLQIPAVFETLFDMSSQGKTAVDVLNTYLYNYTYCTESISITSVPIYYLNPNEKIYVNDMATGVAGQFVVSTINVPLTYNGTMSISATRLPDKLY